MKPNPFIPALIATALLFTLEHPARGASQPTPTKKESPAPDTTAAAQAEAVKKYPALGEAGSQFNVEFVARVRRHAAADRAIFKNERWPLVMADEVAAAGLPSVVQATEPGKPPAVNDAIQGSSRIQLVGRKAIAPADAPPAALRAVEAGNILQTKGYKYGGGRDRLEDSGYDCSGSVSYVLIKAGLLKEPMTSRSFASYGEPGPGRWITVYATPGHAFMTVCGLRLDTGGRGGAGEQGPRWNIYPRLGTGYTLRHPPGL